MKSPRPLLATFEGSFGLMSPLTAQNPTDPTATAVPRLVNLDLHRGRSRRRRADRGLPGGRRSH